LRQRPISLRSGIAVPAGDQRDSSVTVVFASFVAAALWLVAFPRPVPPQDEFADGGQPRFRRRASIFVTVPTEHKR
jgi:hypothetical protein